MIQQKETDSWPSVYLHAIDWYDFRVRAPASAWTRQELHEQVVEVEREMRERAIRGEFTSEKLVSLLFARICFFRVTELHLSHNVFYFLSKTWRDKCNLAVIWPTRICTMQRNMAGVEFTQALTRMTTMTTKTRRWWLHRSGNNLNRHSASWS